MCVKLKKKKNMSTLDESKGVEKKKVRVVKIVFYWTVLTAINAGDQPEMGLVFHLHIKSLKHGEVFFIFHTYSVILQDFFFKQ